MHQVGKLNLIFSDSIYLYYNNIFIYIKLKIKFIIEKFYHNKK